MIVLQDKLEKYHAEEEIWMTDVPTAQPTLDSAPLVCALNSNSNIGLS